MSDAALAPARRRVVMWIDMGLSIIIMLGGFAAILYATTEAMVLLFGPGVCITESCDYYQYTMGWVLAMIGPIIAFTPAAIIAIVLIANRRVSFWVPLVSLGFCVLLWWAGVTLVQANVGGA